MPEDIISLMPGRKGCKKGEKRFSLLLNLNLNYEKSDDFSYDKGTTKNKNDKCCGRKHSIFNEY